jgi:hypothetical protein
MILSGLCVGGFAHAVDLAPGTHPLSPPLTVAGRAADFGGGGGGATTVSVVEAALSHRKP